MRSITADLNVLLADVFALYIKTKNFHWHVSGAHFRDYHSMLDEHAEQRFAVTDDIGERVRKMSGTTIRSVGRITRLKHTLPTTMRNTLDLWTCLANCGKTTRR